MILRPIKDTIDLGDSGGEYNFLLTLVCQNTLQMLYSSIGTLTFYLTMLCITHTHVLSNSVITLSSCCFGIYLFQQFVLKFLYYYTDLPIVVGPYYLPWCGFVITMVVSFFFTRLFLKTKIGLSLIG